jgi:hypothetical protein
LYNLGAAGGEEAHLLLSSEVPGHAHTLNATNNGQSNGTNVPSGSVLMGSGYGTRPTTLSKTSTATLRQRSQWLRAQSVLHCWQRGAARKPDAVFDHQLLHSTSGHFPVAQLMFSPVQLKTTWYSW